MPCVFHHPSPQTKRDSFPSLRFPSVPTTIVAKRRRLHMAGPAEQFRVFDGILATGAPGVPVVEVEGHRAAAALTSCSALCLHLRFDFAPPLIVLGIAEPDLLGYRDFLLLDLGHPVARKLPVWRLARPIFGQRLVAHPVEEQHRFPIPNTQVEARPLFAVYVHRDDAAGSHFLSQFQPREEPLLVLLWR